MPRPSPTIFVIDDEPSNLLLADRVLQHAGFAAPRCFDNPRTAIEAFRREGCDLILLDLNMPGMTGFDVMEEIGEATRRAFVPIIVLTAQGDRETRLRALQAGARDFLAKPFDLPELQARVGNLLALRQMYLELQEHSRGLEARVEERTRDLRASFEELRSARQTAIRRLAKAAEFRDSETGYHIVRMSKIAAVIGRNYGLPADDCEILLDAASMHDIGKIAIPDQILRKPGRLTPAEFEVMKQHTLIGASLLEGDESALLRAAREIALGHHENWDGSGYPHGRRGEGIPLFGRIAAVADVFDALNMARPYTRAWTMADAVAEIHRQTGSKFDPAVVAAFDAGQDEILLISQRFADIAQADQ